MAIDWDALENEIDEALDRAEERTDDKLASNVSSLTRLTDEEIEELFPTPADVKKLANLMKIVKSAEDRNRKIVRLKENIEELGDVVIPLLEKFA